jgi:hypothetical protein
METTIRTKQYGGEIILPNLTSEADAKTYGPTCKKHDLHKRVTDDRIIFVVNPEEENADSSMGCKQDLDSNEIDESGLQYEKHDGHNDFF